MKKNILICFFFFFLASCSNDFLNTSPDHKLTDETFYKTEDHFRQAINGAYNPLRDHSYQTACWLMGEMRSDNAHYSHYSADRGRPLIHREDIANFMVDELNEPIANYWRVAYVGISRANTVIDKIENKDFSTEFKEEIIAQAKFLRAYLYFGLVNNFGAVPLNLHEVKTAGEAFYSRSPVDEVYAQIIEDVKYAAEKLPLTQYNDKGYADGATTKGAAKMLYAYALMTKPNKDLLEAEKQLKEVLSMNYDLLDNYADVFSVNNKNSKEHIFSVQFLMGDYSLESMFLYQFIPKSTDCRIVTGVTPSNNLLIGGWNVPTQRMIESFESGDKRLNTSLALAAGESNDGEVMEFKAVLNVGDPKISEYPFSKPFINKYRNPHDKQNNTNDNWPVYRFADALLLLAENLVEQGKASEAEPYVTRVRTRAGLPKISTITAEIVANERKHELAFENHRWYDLKRTGKVIEVMTEYGKYIKTIDHRISVKAYNVTENQLIHPIPYRERNVNPELTQNPGY